MKPATPFGVLALALLVASAAAQTYPSKPVRIVVPFVPAGPTDNQARWAAQQLSTALGQQFIVDNRPGAGGVPGTEAVVKSAPDGYTLLAGNPGPLTIAPSVRNTMPYDTLRDLIPIVLIARSASCVCLHPSLPARNVKEFIALAKAQPGKINYGSPGVGTVGHFATELFAFQAGVKLNHIPYKGAAQYTIDLIAGNIAMLFDNMPGQVENLRGQKVVGLGVTTGVRVPVVPDVPTLGEAGLPEFKNASWFSFYAKGGTPREVIRKLEMESIKAVNDPVVTARIRMLGAIPIASTADELDKFWKAEIEYWRPIVTRLNLQLD